MDKRPEAEIQVGAALNAVEAIEGEIDHLLTTVIEEGQFPPDVLREIVWARHYAFRVRSHVARVYDRVLQPRWLNSAVSVKQSRAELDNAKKLGNELLSRVATVNHLFLEAQKLRTSWAETDLWRRIWQWSGELPEKITVADIALKVACITANKDK